jgi:DNA replication and repair protein RecF
MRFQQLRIANLRSIAAEDIVLAPGWNVFSGPNGAGKTSLLEAAFLLSHGRSFRSAARDALTRHGSAGFSVFGELADPVARVGLARRDGALQARLDGQDVAVGELLRQVAVTCFEPGSHALIAGAAEERRRYLDWGVFHVEPLFLAKWRRYQRALRQRNALLRNQAGAAELAPWDVELAASGEAITAMRVRYFAQLQPFVTALCGELLVELGPPRLHLDEGYDTGESLFDILQSRRERDTARGHTTAGPHRADWQIGFDAAPRREHLSRGQEKLCAFACLLGQARHHAAASGSWPVLCLDDLASEVDAAHLARMRDAAEQGGAQVLVTGTSAESTPTPASGEVAWFHVEQGRVRRAT